MSVNARGMKSSPVSFPAAGHSCRSSSAAFTSIHAFSPFVRTPRGMGASHVGDAKAFVVVQGVERTPPAAVGFCSRDLAHKDRHFLVLKETVLPVCCLLFFAHLLNQIEQTMFQKRQRMCKSRRFPSGLAMSTARIFVCDEWELSGGYSLSQPARKELLEVCVVSSVL